MAEEALCVYEFLEAVKGKSQVPLFSRPLKEEPKVPPAYKGNEFLNINKY